VDFLVVLIELLC